MCVVTVRSVSAEPTASTVTERLADEFAEAAASARHAGQTELAGHLLDRAEVFRWATSRQDESVEA